MRSKKHREIPNCYHNKSNKINLEVARLTLRNGHLACPLRTKRDIQLLMKTDITTNQMFLTTSLAHAN